MKKIFLMVVAALMATMTFAQEWEWKKLEKGKPQPTDMVNVSVEDALAMSVLHTTWTYLFHDFGDGTCNKVWNSVIETRLSWSAIITAIENGSSTVYYPAIKLAEPEAIDLGLSVNWATFNLGANVPEESGDYFAWGETAPKAYYRPETYTYENNPVVLPAEDDAAVQIWGGEWRMPTANEWQELMENCNVENDNINGVDGVIVTSTKEGYTDKSIFLPLAGYMNEDEVQFYGESSFYWSSSINEEDTDYSMYCNPNEGDVVKGYAVFGLSIRPVCPGKSTPTALENNENKNENRKVMRNGQLIIIRDGVRYNAQGQVVE